MRARELTSGKSADVELTGLFVYVGLQPNTAILRNLVDLSDSGRVPTDSWMKTARDGLYAVGDIRQDSAAQAITSAGDGATAAIAAYRYIKETFSLDRNIWRRRFGVIPVKTESRLTMPKQPAVYILGE